MVALRKELSGRSRLDRPQGHREGSCPTIRVRERACRGSPATPQPSTRNGATAEYALLARQVRAAAPARSGRRRRRLYRAGRRGHRHGGPGWAHREGAQPRRAGRGQGTIHQRVPGGHAAPGRSLARRVAADHGRRGARRRHPQGRFGFQGTARGRQLDQADHRHRVHRSRAGEGRGTADPRQRRRRDTELGRGERGNGSESRRPGQSLHRAWAVRLGGAGHRARARHPAEVAGTGRHARRRHRSPAWCR